LLKIVAVVLVAVVVNMAVVVVVTGVVVVAVLVAVAEVVTSFSPSGPLTKFALMFLLWATPTATPTITPTIPKIPTIMIASPFGLRYHGIEFDLVTSFEQGLDSGVTGAFSSGGWELQEARGAGVWDSSEIGP
jgi:hypothetical protein